MSSTCQRFEFDVLSGNPNQCKNCKNIRAQHTESAPVKRDKIGTFLKAPTTPIIPATTPKEQITEQKVIPTVPAVISSIPNQVQKINIEQQLPIVEASPKPIEVIKQPLIQRNEIEQKANNNQNDGQKKLSVLQMIKEQEEKLKLANLNQYSSTPRRETQSSHTYSSQRPSIASASQSNCSGDTPTSQRYVPPQSNFTATAQITKDQSDKIEHQQQQEDSASNKLEEKIATTNYEEEQKKINEEKEAQQKIKEEQEKQFKLEQEKEAKLKLEKEIEAKQKLERELELKQKLEKEQEAKQKIEKEREEQQKLEKEKLAATFQKQNYSSVVQKDEKPRPLINSNKGLSLAEILAKQKEKIEQGNNQPSQPQVQVQQNPIQNVPQSTVTQGVNIEKQPAEKQIIPKPIQIPNLFAQKQATQINTSFLKSSPPPPPTIQKTEVITSTPTPPLPLNSTVLPPPPPSSIKSTEIKTELPSIPIVQSIKETQNTITPPQKDEVKQPEKEEQKPLGLVALRKLEFQRQQQLQQQKQFTPTNANIQPVKVAVAFQSQTIKKEDKKEIHSTFSPQTQIKQGITPKPVETLQKDEEKNKNESPLNSQESPEVKKPSLISQLKSQLGGNLMFGMAPPPPPPKPKVEQSEQKEQDNNLSDIPFLKVEKSSESQRESYQDVLDRPLMKRNVRSTRKMVLDEDDAE